MVDLPCYYSRKYTRKKTSIKLGRSYQTPTNNVSDSRSCAEQLKQRPTLGENSDHNLYLNCKQDAQARLMFQPIKPKNFLHLSRHFKRGSTSHVDTRNDSSACPYMTTCEHLVERVNPTIPPDPECKSCAKSGYQQRLNTSLLSRLWHRSKFVNPFASSDHHQSRFQLTLRNAVFLILMSLSLVFPPVSGQDDLRCFLLKDGSVQNFFVQESLPVGSKLGTLNIGGDPSEDGDIYLRLENPNAPVQISPNSKDLILTQKLDKEGKNGLSHVATNVICQKRKMNDVDSLIPIVIRVRDSNDNAPVFIKAPYITNVSEATVVGTAILGDIEATDADQKGPLSTVQYSIAPGPHSDKFAFESPLSSTLKLTAPLDYETDKIFNLTIVAEDQGSPPQRTETYLTVQVIDSDDQNPVFTRQRYMAFLPEPPAKGSYLTIQPYEIKAEDQDAGIRARVVYSLGKDVKEESFFSLDSKTGKIRIVKNIPDDVLQQPIVLSVVATQEDNPDRVASAILTISRRGSFSTQLQFLQRSYQATVLESLPKGSLIAQTLINKNPSDGIRFYLEKGGFGMFEVNPAGRVILGHKLDFERQNLYQFKVYATDGEYNDSASVTVKVLNVNDWDPRFQYPQYEFFVNSVRIQPGDIVGNVSAADGDKDHISFTVRGRDASMFDINSAGNILIRRFVDLNSTEAHIVLVAKDTGVPPRQSSAPVTIHFPKGLVKMASLDNSSNFLLMVVFGSLVAVFVLVIVCLAIYIHKNKKYRDDDAAMPTKIISNGTAGGKLDPLTMVGQQRRKDVTMVETTRGLDSASDPHIRREYHNGSLRASTISVQSQGSTIGGGPSLQGSRRFLRNPLANGSLLGALSSVNDSGADSVSLNGSNATTASTATVGSDSPQAHGSRASTPNAVTKFFTTKRSTVAPAPPPPTNMSSFSTFDGTARATGGLPNGRATLVLPTSTRMAPIPPAPPLPPISTKQSTSPTSLPQDVFPSDSSLPSTSLSKGASTLRRDSHGAAGRKIVWPSASIPKKVKKLSWEDELNGQTEMNPEVSVTPMPPSSSSQDSPNLTVYF